MRLAVNTRFLLKNYLEGYGYFIYEVFSRIARNYPEHEFYFLFDRPFDRSFIRSGNIIPMVVGPPARHPLLWKLWYDFRVPSILKKINADVFVSCDGFCSLNTKVPQCLILHDLAFLHYPSFINKSHLLFHRRYMPKFLQKANTIATVSEFSKQDIISNYDVNENKIDVVYSGVKSIFQPLSFEQRAAVKEKYTDGKEYLFYSGSIHPRKNLINLLKAFSVFKKRLQTNTKLIIAGRLAWKYESFTRDLASYKFRDDVILTGYINEDDMAALTASAYAMVYPSLHEGFGVPVLEAMQSGVPVITSKNSAMQEIAGDAAIYADPHSHQGIAEKIMLLYKNETLRNDYIKKGLEQAKLYSWDKTAELLWQTILRTMGRSR